MIQMGKLRLRDSNILPRYLVNKWQSWLWNQIWFQKQWALLPYRLCLRNDDKWFYNVGTAFVMVTGERKNENKGLKLYCNMIIALTDNARIRVKQKHECPSSGTVGGLFSLISILFLVLSLIFSIKVYCLRCIMIQQNW